MFAVSECSCLLCIFYRCGVPMTINGAYPLLSIFGPRHSILSLDLIDDQLLSCRPVPCLEWRHGATRCRTIQPRRHHTRSASTQRSTQRTEPREQQRQRLLVYFAASNYCFVVEVFLCRFATCISGRNSMKFGRADSRLRMLSLSLI